MAGVAQAAVVDVLNIDPVAGTFSGFTSVADTADSFTLTQTFDFDGGGTDDSLSFTLTRTTYASGSISGADVTVGTVNGGGNATNWYNNFGDNETLELEVSNIMYTSGEMDGTTAVFAGFTNFTRIDFGAGAGAGTSVDYLIHTGPVGSTTFTSTGTAVDLTSAGTSSTVFVTAEDGAGGIRIRDLDLQFETVTAVPEPNSVAILLGGLSLMTMRRRRTKTAA